MEFTLWLKRRRAYKAMCFDDCAAVCITARPSMNGALRIRTSRAAGPLGREPGADADATMGEETLSYPAFVVWLPESPSEAPRWERVSMPEVCAIKARPTMACRSRKPVFSRICENFRERRDSRAAKALGFNGAIWA